MIHGFIDLAYAWHDVAELLALHGHVIAPDLRGHGDSDWVGAGGYYHFLDYVADLDDVIAQLARQRVVLVGHSMGGSVASYYTGTRPNRIAGLALIEGIGPPDMTGNDGPLRTGSWIDAWRAARNKVKPLATLDDAVARLQLHDPLLDASLARRLAEHGTRPASGGLVWKHDPLHMTFSPYPFRLDTAIRYWQRITCPVLIVDGDRSKLNLPEDERARRRAHFANHRHVVIADAGHTIHRHQPTALSREILTLI
ncbi:MAG: alpha/beta fold hydrolase [Kofleriaceae bacterium]